MLRALLLALVAGSTSGYVLFGRGPRSLQRQAAVRVTLYGGDQGSPTQERSVGDRGGYGHTGGYRRGGVRGYGQDEAGGYRARGGDGGGYERRTVDEVGGYRRSGSVGSGGRVGGGRGRYNRGADDGYNRGGGGGRYQRGADTDSPWGSNVMRDAAPELQQTFEKKQGNVLPGDWTCPTCGANVFASKSRCFQCQTPNPDPMARAAATARRRARGIPPWHPDSPTKRGAYVAEKWQGLDGDDDFEANEEDDELAFRAAFGPAKTSGIGELPMGGHGVRWGAGDGCRGAKGRLRPVLGCASAKWEGSSEGGGDRPGDRPGDWARSDGSFMSSPVVSTRLPRRTRRLTRPSDAPA